MRSKLTGTAKAFLNDFFPVFLSVLLVFLLSRCYEWGITAYQHGLGLLDFSYFVSALLQDLASGLADALPLALLFQLVKGILPAKAVKVTSAAIVLAGACNLLLITYFSSTLVPVGSEFWAYSPRELYSTVIASGKITPWSLLGSLTILVFLFWLVNKTLLFLFNKFAGQHTAGLSMTGILLLVILFTTSFVHKGKAAYYGQNKLAHFLIQSIQTTDLLEPETAYRNLPFEQEYPFLKPAGSGNVFAPFFKESTSPPNIVFIVVESLGGEFVGPGGQWGGFTPFLDSLAQKGLFWKNGLSLSGRTFGLMPSLLGSLPPRSNGFMNLGPTYPDHQSLLSILDDRGYHTAFYGGYDTFFDNLDYFLDYQGTDFILNKQKIKSYRDTGSTGRGYNYWGFSDKTMLNIASGILDTTSHSPRLEIYHTLQSHSPFTVPDPDEYRKKFNKRLENLDLPADRKKAYRQYRNELTTLLYTDNAIEDFVTDYRKRKGYQNTLFIITGDHWLIPVPQNNQISRYHVPIIIYSPLLEQSATFASVNTHANILPSLVSYLEQNTPLSMPKTNHWIGGPMDTSRTFRNTHSMPLMKNKTRLTDYLDGQYYLSGDQLYRLETDLRLAAVSNDMIRDSLRKELYTYKIKAQYAIKNNKLFPGNTAPRVQKKYNFIARYDTMFKRIDSLEMNSDQQFQLARKEAFRGHYEQARAIAKRLVRRYPDYHDVRLLLGRTYAWEGDYKQAKRIFNRVLEIDSSYYDTYNALFDLENWAENPRKALEIINKGLKHHPDREQFLVKKVRVLGKLKRWPEAKKAYRLLKRKFPRNEQLVELKKYITE